MTQLQELATRFNMRAAFYESAVVSGNVRGKNAAVTSACADCWRSAADEVLLLAAKLEMVT